jgi:uncharacterized membrane protein YraQ (UPF0718 family)
MKRNLVAAQLAPLAGAVALLLTALILRDAFHLHREVAVLIGALVGGLVVSVIIKIKRHADERSDNDVK